MSIFTDGSLYARNKLGMVNICLSAIGEAPLPNETILDSVPVGTDAYVAKDIVHETMLEVQSRGWFFNTEDDYDLVPDNNGFIGIPLNVLRVDSNVGTTSVIVKNGKLYDRGNKTFIFTTSQTMRVVFLIDYENLPINAYQYIAYRAARKFQQRVIGSENLGKFTQIDEQDAFINLQREELQYNDYSMIETRITNRRTNPRGV